MDYFVIGDVCNFKALYIGLICVLEFDPAKIELPLKELEPKHVPEKTLILWDSSLIKYQIQRKKALEV